MGERWATIQGYPNYQVSTKGRVLTTDGVKKKKKHRLNPMKKIMVIYVLICIRMDNVVENVFTYW